MKKLLLILPLLLYWSCDEEQEPEDCAGVEGGDNICGCTDTIAINFDSNATYEDGSCEYFEIVFTAVDGLIDPRLGSVSSFMFYSPTAYLLYNIETYASIRPHQRVWIHHYVNYSLNATHSMTIDEWTVRWDSTYINSTLNLPSGENNFTPVQHHYSEAPQEYIPITSSFNLSIAHDNNEMGYVATNRNAPPDTTFDYVYIPLIHAILDEYNSEDLPFSILINGNYEKNIGESVGFEYIYSDTFSVLIDTAYTN